MARGTKEKKSQTEEPFEKKPWEAADKRLKVPHHGRENGCSQAMFEAFDKKPLLRIASDEVLNEKNEGTSNIQWYSDRTSDEKINIDGTMQNRKILTTRKDKDIYLQVSDAGIVQVNTNCFQDRKGEILKGA